MTAMQRGEEGVDLSTLRLLSFNNVSKVMDGGSSVEVEVAGSVFLKPEFSFIFLWVAGRVEGGGREEAGQLHEGGVVALGVVEVNEVLQHDIQWKEVK
jgi:hypothetical protein